MGDFVKDKVVIVTGSGSGIGRDFALEFAEHGAKVIVNDVARSPDDGVYAAESVAKEIIAKGGNAVAVCESVADESASNHMVEAALDNFGRIDAVVNNAGILRDKIFFKMSHEEWDAVVNVHLRGSFNVSRAAAPYFKEQQSGSFINITSTSGLIGNIGQANYAAAKMGIVGLSKSLAMDMQKFGVRSNCIAPWAWTAMTQSIPADTEENIIRIEKMKRMEARKIAPLAVYLASDKSTHVSGQIFGVRANEIYFFNQIRMTRSVHRENGWTPEDIAEHAMPAFEAGFFPNVPSAALTPWDPI